MFVNLYFTAQKCVWKETFHYGEMSMFNLTMHVVWVKINNNKKLQEAYRPQHNLCKPHPLQAPMGSTPITGQGGTPISGRGGGYSLPVLENPPPLGLDRGPPTAGTGWGYPHPLWTDRQTRVKTLPSLVLRTRAVKMTVFLVVFTL